VQVSQIHETDNSIRFHVSRTGVPVVVRTSYFPNWHATGAGGPWRLTPNLMVVVPTRRNVVVHFDRSAPEKWGAILSALGLVGLGGLVVVDVRRRRRLRAAHAIRGFGESPKTSEFRPLCDSVELPGPESPAGLP
jgi:hypothetical protein